THASDDRPGAISVDVSGGRPPYRFFWSTGHKEKDISGLSPGKYVLTVRDAEGCAVDEEVEIRSDSYYCESKGRSTAFEWIESVRWGNFTHSSGANGGYADFTSLGPASLEPGKQHAISLEPGYRLSPYAENWRVWIDFNQDGDFADRGEEVLARTNAAGMVESQIFIPAAALPGLTRIRVAMQYGTAPMLCDDVNYGEIEDYLLMIESPAPLPESLPGTGVEGADRIGYEIVFPNPARRQVNWRYFAESPGPAHLQLTEISGRLLKSWAPHLEKGWNQERLALPELAPGVYLLLWQAAGQSRVERLVIR
ncbi:MAG: GEVED domain-containing protein, partial [Saprospiraceae bacterium]|nr:GEVED domain-containing protein [Saprospiraceae bacterium]